MVGRKGETLNRILGTLAKMIFANLLTPPKTNECPPKGRDYFIREYIWNNHWFSGDMLIFRGVAHVFLLKGVVLRKNKQKTHKNLEFLSYDYGKYYP